MSNFSWYYDMQRYELHKSHTSDDFVYWFRNDEHIFQAVFKKNSLKMSVLYWIVPYTHIHIQTFSGFSKIKLISWKKDSGYVVVQERQLVSGWPSKQRMLKEKWKTSKGLGSTPQNQNWFFLNFGQGGDHPISNKIMDFFHFLGYSWALYVPIRSGA